MHKAYIIIIGLQTDTSLSFFYCSNVYKYFTMFLCVNTTIASMQIDTLSSFYLCQRAFRFYYISFYKYFTMIFLPPGSI